MKRKPSGRSENKVNKQREKTEQEIERRVEENRMKKIVRRKEQQEQITTNFEILDWINIESEEK